MEHHNTDIDAAGSYSLDNLSFINETSYARSYVPCP